MLRRDAEALSAVPFDYIVLDEAQAIKNALSGTPIENHQGELWSRFEFLNPGLMCTCGK